MQRILITGANRGIGLGLAQAYLARGDRVIAACRHPDRADGLNALPGNERLDLVALDVTDEAAVADLPNRLPSDLDALDLLINNAGLGGAGSLDALTGEEMVEIYRVNVPGPVLVTRALRPLLARGNNPRVVNISSRMGSCTLRTAASPMRNYGYAASKAALNMVSRQLALDLHDDGIAVVAQSPGWVRTDMGGPDAHLSVEESIGALLPLFDGFGMADSGRFVGEEGDDVPF